jgi:hypothetical protein
MALATQRPIVIYDTSAVNALYNDLQREARLRTLRGAYHPRLVFSVVDELVATRDPYKNKQLFDMALSLQSAGDCMLPFHYLLISQIRQYVSVASFDWRMANCDGHQMREAIIDNRHGFTDQLTREQRDSNKAAEDEYKDSLKAFRELLQDPAYSGEPFLNSEAFMRQAFQVDGRFWKLGASLMNKALEIIREEQPGAVIVQPILRGLDGLFAADDAREFAAICPPFNSLLLGIAQTEYSRVHDPSRNRPQRDKSAGRTDTYMSIYLPYCRFFVTNDLGQLDTLDPTAVRSGCEAEVMMYDDFWNKMPY